MDELICSLFLNQFGAEVHDLEYSNEYILLSSWKVGRTDVRLLCFGQKMCVL